MIRTLCERVRAAALALVIAALLLAIGMDPASAQQPANNTPMGNSIAAPHWQFNVAPYLWLPTAHVSLNYDLPAGLPGSVGTDISSGPGDYLKHLNFAAMTAAEARYQRYSLLTDFMYTNFSATGGANHLTTATVLGSPRIPIGRSAQLDLGTRLQATIWTLAGGYTVLEGPWGNLDVLVGFRGLSMDARTDYDLALSLTGPHGHGRSFGGSGSLAGNDTIWNGIAGLRGRIRLSNTGVFFPYYFDIGGGGSQPTWQIAGGVGYQTGWAAVSLTYRYLSFDQHDGDTTTKLSLGGPMMMVSFAF